MAKAIDDFAMIAPGERVLVAVSGGKDSLALWDILLDLGYEADGLYLGLGIGDYSDESRHVRPRLRRDAGPDAASRSTCRDDLRLRRPDGGQGDHAGCRARRAGCRSATCSTRPRATAATTSSATGHNLDDEAAVLFGNVLRWETDYLGRQLPVLPAGHGFPRKVKPLVRLGEREMAAYCVLRGIDYIVEECPMAAGNKHLGYKEALNAIEAHVAGHASAAFYFGFLERAAALFRARGRRASRPTCAPCRRAARRRRARSARSAGSSTRRGHAPVPVRAEGPAPVGRRPTGGAVTPFALGDKVLLIDAKQAPLPDHAQGRRRVPQPRRASCAHDELIGAGRGHARCAPPRRQPYTALRPTLEDFVLKMPRGAQVIYPKDLGADPDAGRHLPGGPGARDAASGRVRCRMTLLRAGRRGRRLRAAGGLRRPRPRRTSAAFLGDGWCGRYRVELRDCYEGIDERAPRPRRARPARAVAGGAARREGAACPAGSCAPTRRASSRPSQTREALASGPWIEPRTLEVLQRTWHIEGQAVRPDHRMVAHTGFLTTARFLGTATSSS